jgi:hypothetical protein
MTFVWGDRNQHYFISTISSLGDGGETYTSRLRWWQINTENPNAVPERLELEAPQPKAAKNCYSIFARIECHQR